MVKHILLIMAGISTCSCSHLDIAGLFVASSDGVQSRFEQSLEMGPELKAGGVNADESYLFYVATDPHVDQTHMNLDVFTDTFRNDPEASFGVILGDCTDVRDNLPNYLESVKYVPERHGFDHKLFHVLGIRDRTPIDIDGNYNFDVLEAVDLELFNNDMMDLLGGETIEMPHFDFKTGRRQYKGDFLKFDEKDILVIEGIHGLNPKTTESLPPENIYKIYISALTSLNIDEHNRIPSTDARLLRRLVRDARIRGYTAQETLRSWKKVREGEENNIYPFQEDADAVFNSVLIYELAVLKQFAEPLLLGVKQNEPEYYEAKRLIKFLDYFVGIDPTPVPGNSICREFVGGGIFPV